MKTNSWKYLEYNNKFFIVIPIKKVKQKKILYSNINSDWFDQNSFINLEAI
jgi:hypothetical protein